ncbi:NADH dehydrogenase [ubiquinone] 1 alpha subcomplex assembly factor 2 [Bacillus rossius redtenbacheri]|uniref:NADH dehydrogenase [ubiquinone] 1 alpha subcomplex assembly factor 2 n=1 Tax=Bacillus rossius redtenbacheri TaxID=93214 RepID=UPI002FDD0B3E
MAKEGRGIVATILKNLVNSLRPRQMFGNEMGKDHLGNTYFEIPADPRAGKRRAERWFAPKEKEDFEQQVPAEWEAWLRGRRSEAPKEEEVLRNLALMQVKKENARKIAEREAASRDSSSLGTEVKGKESFPARKEYEIMPGKPQNK